MIGTPQESIKIMQEDFDKEFFEIFDSIMTKNDKNDKNDPTEKDKKVGKILAKSAANHVMSTPASQTNMFRRAWHNIDNLNNNNNNENNDENPATTSAPATPETNLEQLTREMNQARQRLNEFDIPIYEGSGIVTVDEGLREHGWLDGYEFGSGQENGHDARAKPEKKPVKPPKRYKRKIS